MCCACANSLSLHYNSAVGLCSYPLFTDWQTKSQTVHITLVNDVNPGSRARFFFFFFQGSFLIRVLYLLSNISPSLTFPMIQVLFVSEKSVMGLKAATIRNFCVFTGALVMATEITAPFCP